MHTWGVTLRAGRYQRVRELGQGATARVDLALDQETQTLVAIKRLLAPGGRSGARMRREFRALARLRHENVVRVLDIGEQDGQPFIVMEYVPGQDLSAWLAGGPSLERITRVYAELAAALDAVHAEGLIHRDLKPENVRVTPSGSVKLMDFGLAKDVGGSVDLTQAGAVVGTVLYMSPEQCRGQEIDARADLYAFGALLYRALTGRPPFGGDSIPQVLMAHVSQRPTPPRSINPLLPDSLNALVLSLLAKNPAERPSSARETRELLLASLSEPRGGAVERLVRGDAMLVTQLIGREAELDALRPLLGQDGATLGLTVVTGEAGVGKTRLLRALAEEARDAGLGFAWAAAIPHDPRPFGVAGRLVEALSAGRAPVTTALEPEQLSELARIARLPGLTDAAVLPARLNEADAARYRLFEAFTRLLELAAPRRTPVLENLHLADAATLELLAYATRALPNARIIFTYRLDELPAGASGLNGITPRRVLNLTPLSGEASRELLSAWLGGPLEDALSDELLRPAGGNPWVLEERLKALLEAGAISERAGVFEWNRATARLPEALNELLGRRLADLPAPALEFASAASVLGPDFLFEDARALLGWPDDPALDALEALARARIVRETPGTRGEGFSFTRPLYAEALAGGLLAIKRRRLHAKALALLRGRAGPLELLEHAAGAGQDAAAARLGLQAGERALAAYGYPQAERAYRLALDSAERLSGWELVAQRARLGLGLAMSGAGRNDDALALWATVAGIEAPQGVNPSGAGASPVGASGAAAQPRIPVPATSQAGAGDTASLSGSLEEIPLLESRRELALEARLNMFEALYSRSRLDEARALLGEPDENGPLFDRLAERLGFALALQGENEGARAWCVRALKAARLAGHGGIQAAALSTLALLETTLERPRRAERLLRLAARLAAAAGDGRRLASTYSNLGVVLGGLGRPKDALDAYDRSYEAARATAYLKQAAIAQNNGATLLMAGGDFGAARERLNLARPALVRLGDRYYEAYVQVNLGLCAYALSDLNEAKVIMRDVEGAPEPRAMAQLFTQRLNLELNDEPLAPPDPTLGERQPDLYHLVLAQTHLAAGNHAAAAAEAALTAGEWAWHAALVIVNARWQAGQPTAPALTALQEHALSPEAFLPRVTLAAYTALVAAALRADERHAVPSGLMARLNAGRESPIGQFARLALRRLQA